MNASSMATSSVVVLSSEHGRLRRAQRLIDKKDLQAAVKHGKMEENRNERGDVRLKFTFADVVYITDITGTREVTSWAVPGAGLDVETRAVTAKQRRAHDAAVAEVRLRPGSWTSHSVVVVDQSGSMRKTDVIGGSTRSDAVWLLFALDFVAKRLEEGTAKETDVVSVVSMAVKSHVLVDRQPTDWVLYNNLVQQLRTREPHFQGNYSPALDAAERLLLSNASGSCALSLFFLSDGRPSDPLPRVGLDDPIRGMPHMQKFEHIFGGRIESLSSRFGRRLSIVTVGFGGPDEDFRVLEEMAKRAECLGSRGFFRAASLKPESLGLALSSLVNTLTTTQTELTAIGGTSQRAVRDVLREARDLADDRAPTDEWLKYVKLWRLRYSGGKWSSLELHAQAQGAAGVAMRKKYFGEGAERLVRKFRMTDRSGAFVGPLLVAKETRFIGVHGSQDERDFHRTFCDSQTRAQKLAIVFNSRLDQIPNGGALPRITFLECSVYVVNDVNLGDVGLLVEKQLDPEKYKKWNDNKGTVDGQQVMPAPEPLVKPGGALFALAEEEDDEEGISDSDDDEDDDDDDGGGEGDCLQENAARRLIVSPAEVAQAFSHFTYRHTKRRMLVCDLQGVFNAAENKFEFTDPVIHYRSRRGRRCVFGRTDRSYEGVRDFLRTHQCGELCRMLGKRWARRNDVQQIDWG